MYRTLLCLGLILAANGASAQVPRKKACDFLTQADISAVLGVAVGSPGDPRNEGKICQVLAAKVELRCQRPIL